MYLFMLIGVVAIMNLAGCVNIPDNIPMRTVTYKLDKSKGEWMQSDCVISHNLNAHRTEAVCQEQIIAAPPVGIENRLRQALHPEGQP